MSTSLRSIAARGIRWTTLSALVVTGAQLLQLWIATQIVSPEEIGLFYIMMMVIGFLRTFADGGFTFAVFHRRIMSAEELCSVYWITVVVGVALYAGTAAFGAPLLAMAYDEPRLRDLIALGTLSFVMVPFGLLYSTLLRKNLRFDLVAKIEMAAALAGLAVMSVAALRGHGLSALVAGLVGGNLIRTGLFMTVGCGGWRPELRVNFRAAAYFIRFGSWQVGERLTNYVALRSDQILISAFLGVEALGFYALAWNLVVDPIYRINPIITRVFGALLATVQDEPDRLKRGFLTLIEVVAMINLPLVAGIGAIAPLFVPVFFGAEWTSIVPIIQILAFVGAGKAIANPTGPLVLAKGRPDLAFRWTLISTLCQVPLLLFAVYSGSVLAVAGTVALFQLFVLGGIYTLLYRPLLGPCLGAWLRKILEPLALACAMAALVVLAGHVFHLTGIAGVAVSVALGGLCYAGLYLLLRKDAVISLTRVMLGR